MTLRRLATVLVLTASLAAPAAAEASTLSREGTTVVFRDTEAGVSNSVYLISVDGTEHIIGDQLSDLLDEQTIVDDDSGCTAIGYDFSCPDATAFRVETGPAYDEVNAAADPPDNILSIPLTADIGDGGGRVTGGLAADTLRGGSGDDNLNGGGGDDSLDGGFGADWLEGGGGLDVVNYATRTEAVRVDLGGPGGLDGSDGSSSDGVAGSRDMIQTDVEGAVGGGGDDVLKAGAAPTRLTGGGGADSLAGSQGADTLSGGDGADTIVPLGGADIVSAGAGTDQVGVRDGESDTVDCGPDGDHVVADLVDVLTSCDPPTAGSPGPTVITNTVVVPGASRVFFDLGYTFSATRRGTVLRNFAAEIEPGARVAASCRLKGKRCERTRDLGRATAAASTRLRGFEGRRLPVGAKLTIRVTKDGRIGVVKTLTIRRGKAPSLRTLCLPAGATSPSAC